MNTIVFWDFDGTLAHTGSIWGMTIQAVLREYAPAADLDEIRTHLHQPGGYTWEFPHVVYSETGSRWWDKLFAHINTLCEHYGIPAGSYDEINQKIHSKMTSPNTYTLYDDAKDVLRACTALGVKNYILSNNYPELPQVIKALGLDDSLSGYVVSAQIGYEKPNPGIFSYALSLAQALPGKDRVFMVGDNPVADMQGGKSAGLTTIYAHPGVGELPCAYADYQVDSLSEIPKLLQSL